MQRARLGRIRARDHGATPASDRRLSRVYEKLGVANRAEAVGVSLDPDA